jgi:hypothetical protein
VRFATSRHLKGVRFGRLIAVYVDRHDSRRRAYWMCTCDCGLVSSVRIDRLTSGETQSCGCLHADLMVSANPMRRTA